MNPADLIAELRRLDVKLWEDGGRLCYDAPKGVLTPELRQKLISNKKKLLQFLKGLQDISSSGYQPIRAVPRDHPLPLSYGQERLLFLEQLSHHSDFYILGGRWRLEGVVDRSALQKSLDTIVERHEVLRTTFRIEKGEPNQIIGGPSPVSISFKDLAHYPDEDRHEEMQHLTLEESRKPFDLFRGPVFRAQLIRLDVITHILVLSMHHIVSDGWSLDVLFNELGSLYKAYAKGEAAPLNPLPIQYADFSVWQRRQIEGEKLAALLSYWRRKLSHLPKTELPTDRPRPPVQTNNGASRSLYLSPDVRQALKQLSLKQEATLFMVLFAAFNVLVRKYTGQEDIVVGTPIANRTHPELEALVGFFVNTLVFRTDFGGDPTFIELIARVREVALNAYQHQDLPFERLVEELQPGRDMSRSPLFQVLFSLQNSVMADLQLENLTLSQYRVKVQSTRFDLEAHIWDLPEGLRLSMIYNSDLFDSSTIQQMLAHFKLLLEEIARDPRRRISQLPLLNHGQRHKIITHWNQTTTEYPRDKTIHALFEEQVVLTPDAVAVVCGKKRLTYRELNKRANQLAQSLSAHGVQTESMVAICFERNLDMIVSLLGILKAGGAYVPLDPDYPGQRLALMLADTGASMLLIQDSLKDHIPEYAGKMICLDSQWEAISQYPTCNPKPIASAENLAYVMYTSGSTGQPKGTLIPHMGVVRLVKGTDYVTLGPREVIMQFAPISFDASTFEIWGSLLNGGKLVIFPAGMPSLAQLGGFIHKEGITTLWLTAALFHQMVDECIDELLQVPQILAGGETLSVKHVQQIVARFGDHKLINGYGPTESTTFTTCHGMTTESRIGQTVPIGKPIANTQVYILDDAYQAVPIGVQGDLYIGGDGLARGYLNRPGLTAERFIPNPLGYESGARLYRTGDQARYLQDGSLEFMGRTDHQVKIRGFRVELGEIETVLGEHPDVKAGVVICREDVPGEKRLSAYIIANNDSVPVISEVRRFLTQRLPADMVPPAFVVLSAFPLTPNGKIDRAALPKPDTIAASGAARVLPETPAEQKIAAIWRDILHLDYVGIHDNFFDLGGHSLLVMRLHGMLCDTFGCQLSVVQLFEYPTVHTQAKLLGVEEFV